MDKKLSVPTFSKANVAVLVLALVVGGVGSHAAGVLNTASGGYLVCVNSTTKVITHPGTSTCPKGYKKLVLGAQGTTGLSGKDGATLWNGIKDPETTLGAPGDMFINTTTKVLFGPKDVVTGWPAGVSMVGPSGSGSVGPTGAAGAPGSNATLTCAQGGTCIVGNTGPGGGIVFYVQTATAAAPWRYMEAAPNTWSGGVADPDIKWCSNTTAFVPLLTTGTNDTVSTLTAVGTGARNTKMMLRWCQYGAANMAVSYNGGGKNDWFLPSSNELGKLRLEKITVGGFINDSYWSSSDVGANAADLLDFNNSDVNANLKSEAHNVRPIRAF